MLDRARGVAGCVLVLAIALGAGLESTSVSRRPPKPSAASRANDTPVLEHVPGGGPDGAWIYSLAVTNTEPTALYAAAFDGGVFVSRDRGLSWTPADRGLPPDVGCEIVAAPAPVPTLYAACGDGLFKTTNGGALWIQLDLDNPVPPIIAPSDGRVLYMPPNGSIVRSANGGHQWEQVAMPAATNCGRPVVHPAIPSVLFCVADWIETSHDGGVNWAPLSKAPAADVEVSAAAVHPSDGNTILVGAVDGRTFRTTDGGTTWQGSPSRGEAFYGLQFIGASGDVVYAQAASTIRRSLDGGGHWETLPLELGPHDSLETLAVDPSEPSTVYVGTHDGVLVTTDFGRSWTRRRAGLTRARVSLSLEDGSALTLRADTGDEAFVSRDEGTTWTIVSIGDQPAEPGDATLSPSSKAPGPAGIILPNGEPAFDLIRAGNGTRIAYASTGGLLGWIRGTYALWWSKDDGVSWERGETPPGLYSGSGHCCRLLVDPQDHSTAYAVVGGVGIGGGGDLVLRSIDGGRSWAELPMPALAVHLSIANTKPPTLVLHALDERADGGRYALFTSTDRGNTWRESTGLPSSIPVNSMVSDPRRPARLFAGTDGRGVFRSTDAGASWHPVGRPLMPQRPQMARMRR
jgi:photosystem II stability/assembly factor-like uncharacterized protein